MNIENIIEECYNSYLKADKDSFDRWLRLDSSIVAKWTPYTQKEFINKIKTEPKFSEKWGLKIEERELSFEERWDLLEKDKHTQFVKWESLGTDRIKEVLDKENVPTKLITLTYNGETIESYE